VAVSLVPTTVEPSSVAERWARTGTWAAWLVAGCYLFGALAVTVHLWADPAGLMQRGDDHDVNLFAWFMRYAATAVAHGHLPALVTTALNAPRGINVMWNTSFLLPGILLTPVTLLAGPQVSLTIVLTLSIAGSAASLFFVLRRWGASHGAAALGGAVYGFSPALLNSGIGHYHLVLAVLPPLIIDALLRIMTGRSNPVRAGAWLGLLTAAQVFIGEEELVFTAVAGLAFVAALALGHPRAVRRRAPAAALGVLTAAAVALAISGYPLWVQFRGPLHQHGKLFGAWSGNLGLFVDPSGDLLFHTPASAQIVAAFPLHLPEVLSYLGWPLIMVLVAVAIWFWRDPKVRAAAVSCLVLELCSQGGGRLPIRGFGLSGQFLPYHWLQGLPIMAQLLPGRFCLLADGAAGAVLAFSLDRARSLVPRDRGWLSRIPAAVAVLAALPLIPLPYQTDPVPAVPVGWQQAFARLRLAPDASVLVVPVTLIGHSEVMRWQADTGEPGSMVGGYFLGPGPNGRATFGMGGPQQYAADYLDQLWSGQTHDCQLALVRSALAYWHPAAVIAVTREGTVLGHFLIRLLGPPTFVVGGLLVWRR
jgi:dolichyl-phosphate beta-glucosyltransferase